MSSAAVICAALHVGKVASRKRDTVWPALSFTHRPKPPPSRPSKLGEYVGESDRGRSGHAVCLAGRPVGRHR